MCPFVLHFPTLSYLLLLFTTVSFFVILCPTFLTLSYLSFPVLLIPSCPTNPTHFRLVLTCLYTRSTLSFSNFPCPTHPSLSCLSYPFSYPTWVYPVLLCPTISYFFLPCNSSYPVLLIYPVPCPTLSFPVLLFPIWSYLYVLPFLTYSALS